MGKLLFLLLIAAIAWAFFKKQHGAMRGRADKSAAPGPAKSAERMVACNACGVFMPETDSVMVGGKVSCRDPEHCAHRSP